ncbi:GTPase [Streptomyces radicis]|uniref:ATP-binding protein n=1 Tax=Streptomyces radicis TaxID=1750517 RepID=A0A3A9W6E4_9ACTN|nr:GTPase [Streptomyces radicis]RKN04844.1 ATP-binding protein [Streptomyces radicis]RKN25354.1 ATP-binding protein [Streptomyces radicis]
MADTHVDLPAAPGPSTRSAPGGGALRVRLGALRELVGLSRTRLDDDVLAEPCRVLDEAAARDRLPAVYTAVAIAGATGSGKSTLFNALAGAQLSEAGVRRPTTATAVSCTWEAGGGQVPDGLLERLGIPARARRRAHIMDHALRGTILLDLPDHDSVDTAHREQVDRLLSLVDAVIWVVDPEKYADAVLHERYLRAFAGHADVSLIVLNQADRLPGEAMDAVLDDLRRLLDERGVALGEHGEPGAGVLAVSALTGDGVAELRRQIGELVSARTAAARRLAADVDGVARRLGPVYVADGAEAPAGLTERAREDFDDRLAAALGAQAAGQAAERGWLRRADRACGTPWGQVVRRLAAHRAERRGEPPAMVAQRLRAPGPPVVAGAQVEQAVRQVAADAADGLPEPWARAVRDAARQGAKELPGALESALAEQPPGVLPRPRWWSAAGAGQAVLLAAQFLGICWLFTALVGQPVVGRWLPLALLLGGSVGGPLLAWGCRVAARGPARAFGQQEEWRLRRLAADRGHSHVLEPVAAELMRYREVRERYVVAASPTGDAEVSPSIPSCPHMTGRHGTL